MEDAILERIGGSEILDKRIGSFLEGYRQNIAIIGNPLSGKTSIVERVLRSKYSNKPVLALYTNLNLLTFSDFARSTFTGLLFAFLSKRGLNKDFSLDNLILEAENIIPQTTEKIKEALKVIKNKNKNSFEHISQILDTFVAETNIKILFILDDFTKLKSFPKKVLSDIAKYIITQKEIMYVMINTSSKSAESLLSDELNLLFGNFEKVYTQNLSQSEAENYINLRTGKKLPDIMKKFLLDLTGGKFLYLNILLDKLLEKNSPEITTEEALGRISDLFISYKSSLYQIFSNKIEFIKHSLKEEFLINPLLILIAGGYTRKKDLLSLLKVNSKFLNSRISKLTGNNILNKTGTFYYFCDKMFSYWLSSVLKQSLDTPMLFYSDRKEYMLRKLRERLHRLNAESGKDNFQKFMELIGEFKDDRVKLGKKFTPLPQIKRMRIVPAHNKDMKFIIGEAKNYYLILAFKETSPEDTDILEFSHRCSYFKRRQPKKIFITLNEADLTTKVLAKEKKLFVWERDQVNLLMQLYNKPCLM